MLARSRQRREFAVHGIIRLRRWRGLRRIERQRWRSGERSAHQGHRSEHIGPYQRAPCRDRTAEIMTDPRVDMAIAQCGDEAERVTHEVEQPERTEVSVIVRIPAGGAAIAALVRRDD